MHRLRKVKCSFIYTYYIRKAENLLKMSKPWGWCLDCVWCCLQSNSDEAVKRVLAWEKVDLKVKASSSSKSQDKENREGRDRHRDREVSPKQVTVTSVLAL